MTYLGHTEDDITMWAYIKPTGKMNSLVPDEFGKAVALHITKNQLTVLNTALILAIQGPKGEGKSFQTREICSQMGVYVVPVSGGMLSGSLEGAAVEVLKKAYEVASTLRKQTQKLTVLLIDDFDLSVASAFGDRRYTVNTQLLTAFMMNLADDPEHCGNSKTLRIPIIVTGNDFRSLHSPLTRHGRMNFFEWVPTIEQKFEVVHSLFKSVVSSGGAHELRSFVEEYKQQPVSFFAMLKDDLVNEVILRTIEKDGSISLPSIEKAVLRIFENYVRVEDLYSLASKRKEIIQPRNYIQGGGNNER